MSPKKTNRNAAALVSGIVLATFQVDANADGFWTLRTTAGPSARAEHAVAYDSWRGVTVLVGGLGSSTPPTTRLEDTWEWDGETWTLACDHCDPGPRSAHAMAFDEERRVTVVFGGSNGTAYLNETWEWDGTTWTQRFPPSSPPKRVNAGTAYDSTRHVVLLFGGYSPGQRNDLWKWNGATWEEVSTTSPRPSPRQAVAMAYDVGRDRTVVFGGHLQPWECGAISDETWELDMSTSPATWERKLTSTRPSPRGHAAMAYDSASGVMLLFGGSDSKCTTVFDDTWEWNGSTWTQVPTPGPSPRWFAGAAYDASREEVLLFGGVDPLQWIYAGDTWVFRATEPAIASLDIKPGSCPNPFNRNSRGVLPVGLLGTDSFDATDVDVSSILISRADGVGGQVAPLDGPPGPHSVIEDVGTPFDGEPCDCHDLTGDGIVDLSMKFKTQQVVDDLELNGLDAGAVVELIVSASLLDGTPFEARDCIQIVPPPGVDAVNLSVGSNQPDTYIEVTPSDATTDDSGFTPFDRCYENGTTVTLTAPASSNHRVFAGWRVNGVFQASSQRSIQAVVDGIVALEAVYGSRRSSRLPVAAYDE